MLSFRGYIFLGLNAVRVLSIVSLILVFSSSIFVMVNDVKAYNEFENAVQGSSNSTDVLLDCDYINGSDVPNQPAGIFWAVLFRLMIIFQVIVLFMSEIGWPAVFFDHYFPVLGHSFGLGALGIFECLLGATILSHHVDDFTLVAAFFLFSLGCLNMLLGLIFREKAKEQRSISFWRAETQGILPTHLDKRPVFVNVSPAFGSNGEKAFPVHEFGASRNASMRSDNTRIGYGFGTAGEKAAGLKGFLISRPVESLPRYASPTPSRMPNQHHQRGSTSSASSSSSFASPGSPAVNAPYMHDAPPHFKSSSSAL